MQKQRIAQATADFKKAVLMANNINFEDFLILLRRMFPEAAITEHYAEENWDRMKFNFISWFYALGYEAQEKFFEAVFEKYGF